MMNLKARINETRVLDLDSNSDLYFKSHLFLITLISALGLLKISFKSQYKQRQSVVTALCIFTTILTSTPLLLCIFISFKLYRYLCHLYLKVKFGDTYIRLLEGPDSFWTTNETLSKGIINILALVDFKGKDAKERIEIAQHKFKQRLLMNVEEKFRKLLFQRRTRNFGFTYWAQQNHIDIKDHVKLFRLDLVKKTCTEAEMKVAISKLCNLDLPKDNSTNWEVILLDKDVQTGDGLLSPMLFRIHHSVGDGYALVDLFLNVLIDSEKNTGIDSNVQANMKADENGIMTLSTDSDKDSHMNSKHQYSQESARDDTFVIHNNINDNNINETTQSLFSEYPLEKSFKSKLFTQNMAKLNWNSLKIKTRFFLNMQRAGKESGKINETKRIENSSESRNTQESIMNKVNQPHYETAVLKEAKKKNHSVDSQDKSTMTLELKESAIRGTFFMNEIYFTPLSPMKSSLIFDSFSFNSQGESQKLLHEFHTFIVRVQEILSCVIFLSSILLNQVKYFTRLIMEVFFKVLFLPVNMFLRKVDHNRLHNEKPLSGRKTLCYIFDDNLFEMIKHIKTHKNVRFNEIVLRAVSDSLEMFFSNSSLPASVNVIIPIPITTQRSSLKNDFTVYMFDLCVHGVDKARSIHKKYLDLYKNYEPALTYYILKYLMDSIPQCLLRYIVKSRHSSLALSNMVGPDHIISFSGHQIKRLIFFVPNKDTTGVGVSLLSYNNQLSLGIIMDESLGENCKEDAREILENLKNSVYHMYAECFE